MTFGQLIEYNTRKNMKNHVQNVEEKLETSPRPFFKKSKFTLSLDQQFEFSHSLFLLHVQVEDYQKY